MGLFDGLFSKKNQEQPESVQPKGEFFLNPDEAKTFGNIDYMRTPKAVKKTFPKTKSSDSFEVVEVISSLEKQSPTSANGSQPVPIAAEATPVQPPLPDTDAVERRRTDTNLDMFRSMARDLKGKP